MSSSKTDWQDLAKTDVYFGAGARKRVPGLAGSRRTLLVTTGGTVARGTIDALFETSVPEIVRSFNQVKSHHSLDEIESAANRLRGGDYECIVAVGGGSVIDTAKCFSVLLSHDDRSLHELLNDSEQLKNTNPIPVVAVPTTSGSGSEVTPFATVWDYSNKQKLSLASDSIVPKSAVVDPVLTLSLPLRETLSSGLDAISHAFEAIWNVNATPGTTAVATQALRLGLSSIADAASRADDLNFRTAMSKASLLGGIAISHTRTALAHSASYPLTIHLGFDHGFACAIFLPAVLKFNAVVDDGRLMKLANDLGHGDVETLGHYLEECLSALDLPHFFSGFDLSPTRLAALSGEMVNPQRTDNNMREIIGADLDQILSETNNMLRRLGIQN